MNKKLKYLHFLFACLPIFLNAQVTPLAEDYKIIDIGGNGGGDYTRNLILLHEMYNGTTLSMNDAIGTITALRGHEQAFNRINVVEINSSSAYNGTSAAIRSLDNYNTWRLKTCIYNQKKYLALDVPYGDAYHNWGFKFVGWTKSTGESMKSVAYEISGTPVNTNLISNIQDYNATMDETHQINNFLIIGNNVGIGTMSPDEKLTVKGKVHTQEVRVDMAGPLVPDYVFANDYKLKSLQEIEDFIKENKHLPEVPSAKEIEKNGLMLAEMNMSLLKKMEEMTLYMIEQNKKLNELEKQNRKFTDLERRLEKIENSK